MMPQANIRRELLRIPLEVNFLERPFHALLG